MLDPFIESLAKAWNDFNRMHRGGLGESPRGLADYRRNRWIVGAVLVLFVAASISMWLVWRL